MPAPGSGHALIRGGQNSAGLDAAGVVQWPTSNAADLDRLAGRAGVHHLALAEVYADVADRGVEEQQVAGLQLVAPDWLAHLRLRRGGTWQTHPGLLERRHDQSGTVEGVRASSAVAVGLADGGLGEGEGLDTGRAPAGNSRGCGLRGLLVGCLPSGGRHVVAGLPPNLSAG